MSPAIHDFRLDAIHTFQIRTLRSLGFHTRVTLLNKSHETDNFICDYQIDLTIYGPQQIVEKKISSLGYLPPGKSISLDCRQWESDDSDRIMIFHLIPTRLKATSQDGQTVAVEPRQIWTLIGAQDHHVEYFRDDGFASGVLYQCGAMNYDKIAKDWSTLIQAPKICISNTLNTYLSVIHTSFTASYTKDARLHCALLSPSGQCLAKWTETIRPFQALLINFKNILLDRSDFRAGNDVQFFTLYAICPDATVLPIVLNTDENQQTLAAEHSLPPIYYGKNIGGATRQTALRELTELPFFKDILP